MFAEPAVVKRDSFMVAGVAYEATLPQIEEQELGKKAYDRVLACRDTLSHRVSDAVLLIQVYPMKPGFNPHTVAFTQLIGYQVAEHSTLPEGLTLRSFPASDYLAYTHRGPESQLGTSYDKLYGEWMRQQARRPAGFDIEVWDERYRPEEPDNEIDLFVALAET
ncbi:GyrI-like domain-containing protein [Paenibacillus humicola]|uniref:GyrI-like domain-containing protein n=1 Tax=Paenibacillus humicola TaxID=3110540 RepID=UPI00237C2B0D|nr:effector binding domain-containing protein [Paenibacillus humicola]